MFIYVSGKMTGEPNYRKIFEKHVDKLLLDGNIVANPVQISDDLMVELNLSEEDAFKEENRSLFLRKDIRVLTSCDAIYMIPNWETSKGATFEKYVAEQCGLEIIYGEEL